MSWDKISPTDFEELVFWILHREGFLNVTWYGASGNDKGRDIVCERNELWRPTFLSYKCVVQCKRYTGSVPRSILQEDILKAAEHKPEIFIVATTGILNASTKDWLFSQKIREGMRVVLWERTDIEKLLDYHQDLRSRFLGETLEPDFLLRQLKLMTHKYPDLDCVLLTPTARAILVEACQSALQKKTAVTTANLLAALLKLDTTVTRPAFEKSGINVAELANDLSASVKSTVSAGQESEVGLSPSVGFRLSLEHAFEVRNFLSEGGGLVSERALLIAVLHQEHSKTLEFLKNRLGLRTLISLRNSLTENDNRNSEGRSRGNGFLILSDDTEFLQRENPGENETKLQTHFDVSPKAADPDSKKKKD